MRLHKRRRTQLPVYGSPLLPWCCRRCCDKASMSACGSQDRVPTTGNNTSNAIAGEIKRNLSASCTFDERTAWPLEPTWLCVIGPRVWTHACYSRVFSLRNVRTPPGSHLTSSMEFVSSEGGAASTSSADADHWPSTSALLSTSSVRTRSPSSSGTTSQRAGLSTHARQGRKGMSRNRSAPCGALCHTAASRNYASWQQCVLDHSGNRLACVRAWNKLCIHTYVYIHLCIHI